MPAELSPVATAPSNGPASPFVYADTGLARAGIETVSQRLAGGTVAIVGLGGTGSVVLDLIAKTPVEHILLIDGDRAEAHNAFRWPGAMAQEDIAAGPFKVDYFARVYGHLHRGIVAHCVHLDPDTLALLAACDFVFVCVDSIEVRAWLIPELEALDLPFVDCGLGLSLNDDQLSGLVRVTTSTPAMRAHVHANHRIPATGQGDDDLYRSTIQVADLNMLAATLAVIQYKQLRGFYADGEGEYHCVYSVDGNHLVNEDRA